MPDKSKIVLITSGQPSLNPRLVKEADALSEAGYEVTVIYQYWNAWATVADEKLLKNKKWKLIRVGGSPTNQQATYWLSRLFHKVGQLVTKHVFRTPFFDRMAIGRCTNLLIKKAKSQQADLYIGHNLAALPAAVMAAKKNGAKAGFDAEDFHRHETSDDAEHPDCQLKTRIENRYLPFVSYLTASSPEIAAHYQSIFPALTPQVILNVFEYQPQFGMEQKENGNLKLVWFSQTIGLNRGIRVVLEAITLLPKVEVHLLGDHDHATKQALIQHLPAETVSNVHFYPPIAPSDLPAFCSKFDVGLALEPGFSINNNIALSNKIFTYIQSGLAIIASNTTAQSSFLAQYQGIGQVYDLKNPDTLRYCLAYYLDNPAILIAHQQQALEYGASVLNWQHKKTKFLTIIHHCLRN